MIRLNLPQRLKNTCKPVNRNSCVTLKWVHTICNKLGNCGKHQTENLFMQENIYNQNRLSVQKIKIKTNRQTINANCCITLKWLVTT